MAQLRYYLVERKEFDDEFNDHVSDEIATYFYKRLKAHYKFPQELRFRGKKDRGYCNLIRVSIGHNPSIAVLAHEVAHAIQLKKATRGKKWHGKWHKSIMKRVLKYIKTHRLKWGQSIQAKRVRKEERNAAKHTKILSDV
jgi:hypothetical protein